MRIVHIGQRENLHGNHRVTGEPSNQVKIPSAGEAVPPVPSALSADLFEGKDLELQTWPSKE